MRNMKFAIRKLTVTCILPATLFTGLLPSDCDAQQIPSAVSKANAGMPGRFTARPKSPTAAVPLDQSRAAPAVLVRQNNAPQMRAPNGAPSESDVQRQLRMLYEKNGQDMPAMNFEDLEVPEPQQGTAPNQQPSGGQAPGLMQPGQGYNAPTQQPKAPNFFERVFLGKKAPPPSPPAPRTNLQRPPAAPMGQPQQNPQNYRPFQPGQPGQGVQPAPTYQQPGMYQQPGAQTAPAAQPAPQLGTYGQRPPVQPPAAVGTVQPQANTPVAQPQLQAQPPAQLQQSLPRLSPPAAAAAPAAQQQRVVPRPTAEDVPMLDEEPEESLDIDLTPKSPVTANPSATVAAPSAGPGPAVEAPSAAAPAATPEVKPSASAEAGKPEENPFSGLKLNVPETSETKAPAATSGTQTSPAANAVRSVIPAPQPTIKVEQSKSAPPAITPSNGAANGPTLERQLAPAKGVKPIHTVTSKTNLPPAEILKKLAEAPEKLGLKGFCSVALRQQRLLLETKPQFNVTHQGHKYYFSSLAAKTTFQKSPELFIPTHQGKDAVALIDEEESVAGTLDSAAWYQGRLYLFANHENLELFKLSPDEYIEERAEELTTLTGGTAAAKKLASPVSKVAGEAPATKVRGRTAAAKVPSAFDDLPVLSDNLDALEPIAPPADQGAIPQSPVADQAAPAAPPAIDTAKNTTPRLPAVDSVQKTDVKQPNLSITPRTSPRSAPAQPAAKKAPPKLISPDLRLAPGAKAAPQP